MSRSTASSGHQPSRADHPPNHPAWAPAGRWSWELRLSGGHPGLIDLVREAEHAANAELAAAGVNPWAAHGWLDASTAPAQAEPIIAVAWRAHAAAMAVLRHHLGDEEPQLNWSLRRLDVPAAAQSPNIDPAYRLP